MKIFIEKITIKNRAPFDTLNLDFNENEIAVLTAVNGSGKTTILSHIVDAWYEMAKPHFYNEFEGKENKLYRVSTNIYNLDNEQPSFVYIRFHTPEGNIDYVDIRAKCSQDQYNAAISLENKIPFANIQKDLEKNNFSKRVSTLFDKNKAETVFNNNVITYFPSYRYETPGYLNDPYKVNLDFTKQISFSGYLPNPLEVVTGLPQLANWIMDVVLDMDLYKQIQNINGRIFDLTPERTVLWNSLNTIIEKTLISRKYQGTLRFGIGKRNSGGNRISIMNELTLDGKNPRTFYPTIFNLSSGEAAMLCLFGEILRQADKTKNNIALQQITGIVLIDEVDKHLHIKLQKEVLPVLFQLFPNIQFILSSHSPFLSMGLAEKTKERARIIDLDNMGISTNPTSNELYIEVYNMMIGENERFKELYLLLQQAITSDTKPLIITEGKTDTKHLKKAKETLNIKDCDVEFYEINEDWGDSKLKTLLEHLSKIKQLRKIIGVFDRDDENKGIVSEIEKDGQSYKNYSNTVFAFCIPLTNEDIYGTRISIEHYYKKEDLLKVDKQGRRLFLGEEFYQSGNSKDGKYQTKISNIQHKIDINGVIDEKVYKKKDLEQKVSIAMSKDDFATLIADVNFSKDFDFSKFNLIFDKITQIINGD
jgi:predicted ATP-dependent endonuclease of OLD family